jgi:hypothetical protein
MNGTQGSLMLEDAPTVKVTTGTEQEEWRVIKSVPDYAVSNMGRLKRVTGGVHTWPGRILTPRPNRDGYMACQLCSRQNPIANNHGKVWRLLHRLVLEEFVGARSEGFSCNHINGNKKDNRLENLEWVTVTENNQHALDTGLRSNGIGDTSFNHKLQESDVLEIKKLLHSGNVSQRSIAKNFNVHFATISQIKMGRNWTHVIYP